MAKPFLDRNPVTIGAVSLALVAAPAGCLPRDGSLARMM